jgi:L-alanine-DL-glutamate epimerase-like enolase superfamily enzyme
VKLTLHQRDLPLRHPFRTSHGTTDVHRVLLVELQDGGFHGYGETGASDYYGVTIENMVALLERHRNAIESFGIGEPALLWERLRPLLGECPFAQCAVDMACHDLWGKTQKQPIWKLWRLSFEEDVPYSNFTIGIDSIDVMRERLREYSRWPIYKIKLGTPDDLEIVRVLRQYTDAVFRVDANCGWTASETIANSLVLRRLGVEFIEQPLPVQQWDAMGDVFERSDLPLIADESCRTESDVDRCVGQFHGVNIKLVKCGGMTPARRMIARAKELGLKVMMGCMTETTVGISAIAQFLPLLDYVDMDGALLLAEDVATGVRVERGRAILPTENGCGVTLL